MYFCDDVQSTNYFLITLLQKSRNNMEKNFRKIEEKIIFLMRERFWLNRAHFKDVIEINNKNNNYKIQMRLIKKKKET